MSTVGLLLPMIGLAGACCSIGYRIGMFAGAEAARMQPCVHGHKDWDDCPVCRH